MEKTIQSTNDYSIFKKCEANRNVDHRHVKRLVESIIADNHLSSVPVIVNGAMEVMDGQHRIEAARELQIPVWYTVNENFKIETIAPINNHTKKWTTDDWLSFWISKGNDHYVTFKNVKEKHSFTTASLLIWLTSAGSGGTNYSNFRNGKFIFKMTDEIHIALQDYEEVSEFLKDIHPKHDKIFKNKYFIRSMKDILTNPFVDARRFKDRVKNYYHKLTEQPSREMYLQNLVDIYNFAMRSDKVEVVKLSNRIDIEKQID